MVLLASDFDKSKYLEGLKTSSRRRSFASKTSTAEVLSKGTASPRRN